MIFVKNTLQVIYIIYNLIEVTSKCISPTHYPSLCVNMFYPQCLFLLRTSLHVKITVVMILAISASSCQPPDPSASAGDTYENSVTIGVINGDFESGDVLEESGWTWWGREDVGHAEFSNDSREGERSVKVEREGSPDWYHDWMLTNDGHLDVKKEEVWTVSAWVKYEDTDYISLNFIELDDDGELLVNRAGGGGGTHGAYGTGDWIKLQASSIVPADCKQLKVRFTGMGSTHALIDDVRIHRGKAERAASHRPKVQGWAYNEIRVREELGRGLVAVPGGDGGIYVQWRLLEEDQDDVAFNIYRSSNGEDPLKLNENPVRRTTDYNDRAADPAKENTYFVRAEGSSEEFNSSNGYTVEAGTEKSPYISIPLQTEETTFQKLAIGDLNGDGNYDFVIKTPNSSLDPWRNYWEPSDTSYTLQAYLSDGTFLWEKDLGWNMEAGIWYTPYVVHDFNGDGRAQIAIKTAPTDVDYRETGSSENGHYEAGSVRTGPEYLSILDGMTGEEQARADWPTRDGLGSYNHYSRNQMGVAYLDGKTPAIVAGRGTYGMMKLEAFQYQDNELEQLWAWESPDEPGGFFYGQGAHNLLTLDLDGDGRDEVLLGSAAIDDNGDGLWSTGKGHPDNLYAGNLDPERPGFEVYYGLETDQPLYGINMVDAKTGVMLWGVNQPTDHLHGAGLVSNIDTAHVGMEVFSGESGMPDRWLHSARGELLANEETLPWGKLSPAAVYWDATTQRELLIGNRIFSYPDNRTIFEGVEGHQTAWVDLFGDWREEIITSVPGELRIYKTPVPAKDRRVTMMQNHLYRTSVAHMSMGYGTRPPLTSYIIE